VRLEGLGQLKNPMVLSGIKPATLCNMAIQMMERGPHAATSWFSADREFILPFLKIYPYAFFLFKEVG
jgi:hypothetical protein